MTKKPISIKKNNTIFKKRFLSSRRKKNVNPIVPAGDFAGRALIIVIAIMTFLAALSIGGIDLINQSAKNWESQISREATIQLRPIDGVNMDDNLRNAVTLVQSFQGVDNAKIVDQQATNRLLEPWLGTGLDLDELPIPRLIIVTFSDRNLVDFNAIKTAISSQIIGASFDDHRNAIDRLVLMARATIFIGMIILFLVLSALVLTIIYATRSALAGNAHIVEVLHFIGAEPRFVARQFDKHFLKTGFKGALFGEGAALIVFIVFSLWSSYNMGTPDADQAAALFGHFSLEFSSYLKIFALILCVSILTMVTSRLTILNQLKTIDRRESDLF